MSQSVKNQGGAAGVLLLVSAICIIAFLVISSLAPFKNSFLSQSYPKSVTQAAAVIQPVGQTSGWILDFSDEFSGTSVDLTKWRPNWLGSSDTAITKPINSAETSCYDPAQASVSNGALVLTAMSSSCAAGGVNYNYRSGMVESNGRYNFTYGYMEASIWTPAGAGVWPAFWSDGQNWPSDGEIDVVEAYGTDTSSYHYHYAGCTGSCGPGGSVVVTGATSGWHTYAADWEPGVITWYYDGKEVWKYTTSITASPQFLILNLGLNSTSATVPSTMKVDYVRVWKKDPNAVPTTATFVPANSSWKYSDTGSDLGTAWRAISYDDSGWKSGPAILGYGQGNEATIISYGSDPSNKYPTAYFRKSFTVTDPSQVTGLNLSMLRDDGAVVYLNGNEVYRTNMPTGTVSYSTRANEALDDGGQLFTSSLNPGLLLAGTNTIAVEVHQSTPSSSDLTMQLELKANTASGGATPTPLPTPTSSQPSPTPIPSGDTQAPTVSITSPTNGAILSKKTFITISANAQDNVLVSKVLFYAGSSLICTDTSAPYSCSWKTPAKPGTTTILKAVAIDSSNNQSQLSSVRVTTR